MLQTMTITRSPLGQWIDENLSILGFKTKDAMRLAIGISSAGFNNWQRADVAAVPDARMLHRMKEVLRLTRNQRDELDLVLRDQLRLREEELKKRPFGKARLAIAEQERPAQAMNRIIEYDDPYPNRTIALALAKGSVAADVIDAVLSISNSDGDVSVPTWLEIIKDYHRQLNRFKAGLEETASETPRDLSPGAAEKLAIEKDAKKKRR